MPKSKPEAEAVEDDESAIVDDTDAPAPVEKADPEGAADAEPTPSEGEEADTTAEQEEPPAAQEEEPPVAGAAELAAQRIADLEAENARLKGAQPEATPPDTRQTPGAIATFLKTIGPQSKKQFAEAKAFTVNAEGHVVANPDGAQQQYDAIYTMTDHMIGSILTDHVSPVLNDIAELAITLHNEVEIRDLRATGEVFKSMEQFVREELKTKDWGTRRKEGAVSVIYKKLLAMRNGGSPPATGGSKAPPVRAAAALRDLSAGVGSKPAKGAGSFKLTPEQETDYQDLIANGWPGTREQYHAKWKSRAEKAKAANRSIPKTYRSFV